MRTVRRECWIVFRGSCGVLRYCVSTVLCCIIGSALGQTQQLGPEGEKRRLAPHSEEQSIPSSHSALPLAVHSHIWPSLCRSAVAQGRFPPLRKRASTYRVRPVPIQSAHSLTVGTGRQWLPPVARLQARSKAVSSNAQARHGHGAECTYGTRSTALHQPVRPPTVLGIARRHRQCARIAQSA